MVSTVTSYTDTRNRALPGEGYDGVVRISVGGFYGTGVLLYDGQAILTAAHLFANGTSGTSVQFQTSAGTQALSASKVSVMSSYDSFNTNDDLALVWLNGPAPVSADRYDLYRSNDEIGQAMTMVGYGVPGTGAAGKLIDYNSTPIRLKANNQFDADAADLKIAQGASMSWAPLAGTQLVADFDNGQKVQDALGTLLGKPGMGLGQGEGLITPGDSGGPAFINGKIAGIASYVASLNKGSVHPDIDDALNSSYGEVAAWQRVSAYKQMIDQAVRANYTDAPSRPQDVKQAVPEGNTGASNAYFLLQFTGMRSEANQTLSVDYTTRDGTAKAGQDYVQTQGTLVIYANENQAVIAVQILGDKTPEPDETFYLDVTHPVGGSFGDGVIMLTGMRTIVNDDAFA